MGPIRCVSHHPLPSTGWDKKAKKKIYPFSAGFELAASGLYIVGVKSKKKRKKRSILCGIRTRDLWIVYRWDEKATKNKKKDKSSAGLELATSGLYIVGIKKQKKKEKKRSILRGIRTRDLWIVYRWDKKAKKRKKRSILCGIRTRDLWVVYRWDKKAEKKIK